MTTAEPKRFMAEEDNEKKAKEASENKGKRGFMATRIFCSHKLFLSPSWWKKKDEVSGFDSGLIASLGLKRSIASRSVVGGVEYVVRYKSGPLQRSRAPSLSLSLSLSSLSLFRG